MKKFLIKLFILSSPIIALLILFAVLDPFRIIWGYDDYYQSSGDEILYVLPNRDYVSSEIYLRNRDKYKYNSFIFGSSRTLAFKTKDWMKYLDSAAHPFVFDGSGESIFGIYSKIMYIDKTGGEIRNCIIVLDTDNSFEFDTEKQGHLFLKHPAIAGTSWFNFYSEFIKAYFDTRFLYGYYKYKLTKKYEPPGSGFMEVQKIRFDAKTNEMITSGLDSNIDKNPGEFYGKRERNFFARDTTHQDVAKPLINDGHIEMLREMKQVFNKQHTNYRIIISPLYAQLKLNPEDLRKIKEIFGADNVFDYSGINEFTNHKENYYEIAHYRSFVGDSIMSRIYRK